MSIASTTVSLQTLGTISAFVLSLISIGLTVANQRRQDLRWKQLNAGRLLIVEAVVETWAKFTRQEIQGKTWGHDASFVSKLTNPNEWLMPYSIAAQIPGSADLVPGWTAAATIEEAKDELQRLGWERNASLSRRIRVSFTVENVGKAAIKAGSIYGEARIPGVEWQACYESNQKIELDGGRKSGFIVEMFVPLMQPMPPSISFRFNVRYTDADGGTHRATQVMSWTSESNSWVVGEVPDPTGATT